MAAPSAQEAATDRFLFKPPPDAGQRLPTVYGLPGLACGQVFLRNLNHSRRVVVRTVGAPTGRLILPGATTAMAIEPATLADPAVQARLAQVRVAVLGRAGWCADLRQRRAGGLNWAELIAQAERAEIDRLRAEERQRRPWTRRRPRKRRANEWPPEWIERVRQRWAEGATAPQIAAELGAKLGTVQAWVRRLRLRESPASGSTPACPAACQHSFTTSASGYGRLY
jgi:hypothetical protein